MAVDRHVDPGRTFLIDKIRTRRRLRPYAQRPRLRYQQVEIMQARNNRLEPTNQLSQVEREDLFSIIVEMPLREVAIQAALGASAKALQPTLMDCARRRNAALDDPVRS